MRGVCRSPIQEKLASTLFLLGIAIPAAVGAGIVHAAEIPFGAQRIVSTADSRGIDVIAGDLDGDGDLDLVASAGTNSPSGVYSYENLDGRGTFSASSVIDDCSGGLCNRSSIELADMDGDGDLDLLTGWVYVCAWYPNDGQGSFGARTVVRDETFTGAGYDHFSAGDLDGDGDLDVVGVSGFVTGTDKLVWFRNLGGGAFNPATENVVDAALGNGNGLGQVVPADLDGDGDLDLVATETEGVQQVVWYENTNGAGTFSAKQTISTAPQFLADIEVVDMDRDGDLDVVSIDYGLSAARWHENTAGDGSAWTDRAIPSFNAVSFFVEVADMDLDGDPDVLLATRVSDTARWIENTAGDGSTWVDRQITTGVDWPTAAIAADLDGDGDPDVATASLDDNKIAWNENRTIHRSAAFELFSAEPVGFTGNDVQALHAADVDGDGAVDVLAAGFLGDATWFENDPPAPTWTDHLLPKVPNATAIWAADLDADGDTDVLAASDTDDSVTWFENDGAASPDFVSEVVSANEPGASFVAAADVDGDGDIDAVAAARGSSTVAWFENDGGSPPSFSKQTISTSIASARVALPADVDGDGDVDVLSASFTSDAVYWHENSGSVPPTWTTRTIGTGLDGARFVRAADIDRDGDLDVVSVSQNDRRLVWHESDGQSPPSWTPHDVFETDETPWGLDLADLDQDGDVDLLTAEGIGGGEGAVLALESNGGSPPLFTDRWILIQNDLPRAVAAADVDRDGDDDVVVSWLNGPVSWTRNIGGQFRFDGEDTSSDAYDAELAELLAIDVRVNGRPGDAVGRLVTLDLRFDSPTGLLDAPLDSAQANALIDELRLYRDDGDYVLEEAEDVLVTTVGTLSLTAGVQTITLAASDPNARVAAPATFLVVARMTETASSEPIDTFYVTHLATTGSTVVDAASGVALSGEGTFDLVTDEIQALPRLVVDTFSDGVDVVLGDGVCATSGGDCSLRAAIQEANALAGTNRIVLGSGTYTLALAGSGEDAAATGDLDVTDAATLTIVGRGADRTVIDGAGLDRVFHALTATPLVLRDLTVTGGATSNFDRGAGLRADGDNFLIVERCTFRDNRSFDDRGGAISSGPSSNVTIDRSSFHGNQANDGGTVIDSGGFMNLINTTIAGNLGPASSVAVESVGAMNVVGCTITGNVGGLRAASSSITVENSIVARNDNPGLSGDDISTGTFTSAGYNVIGESASGAFVDGVNGDQVGSIGSPLDAFLRPLADHGGGTLTCEPAPASPAVDAGSCPFLAVDQRGVARPIDVPGVSDAADGCDSGAFELASGAALAPVQVPVRWCGLRGAPSIEDPKLLGSFNVNDLLRRRHEVVTDHVYGPQGSIFFRSAANAAVPDFPLLEDPDCVEDPPGVFTCAHGQRGDVYIDPAAAVFDEFEELIAACRAAWHAQDPEIQGITAVHIRRFTDKNGTPLEILGIGGRAAEGDAREQAVAGRVAVVDHYYRQAAPGNPSPPNPEDTLDRLLGHEVGHALSLRHGDGLDNDGNTVVDDDDEAPFGLPRFDGDNIMQYRAGTKLSVGQVAQARSHLAATVPDVVVQPLADSITSDVPIDPKNARVLEFGFDGVLDLANARVLEFKNASVLEFENESVLDFANARVLEFKNASVLEFKNARVLEFGMTYTGEQPSDTVRLHASTAALPWPPALRPATSYWFYLDVDRDDATGGYPAREVNPSDAPNPFPGSSNFTSDADVAEEAGVDLIAEVRLEASCPAEQCTSTSTVRVWDYDDGTGEFVEVSSANAPTISAVGVGLYVDNGGAPVDLDSAPSGITVQPELPISLLFDAGWGFGTPSGGGAPVPDRVRMEVVTTIDCAGDILNDDPSSGARDCQCTSCEDCPDYPGCSGTTGTPDTLVGSTILTDRKAGELDFQPPVLPSCAVFPALTEPGQTVTVFVTDLPTGLAGDVVVEHGASVIGTVPAAWIDASGAVAVAATLPAGVSGDLFLGAGIDGLAPRARCEVAVTPDLDCPDNDGDRSCDVDDVDDDGDGVADGSDAQPANPLRCRDVDADQCDDCSSGSDDPSRDGPDFDLDGLCDFGDDDDDNDGVLDLDDGEPTNANACGDADLDRCDDCVLGATPSPANDGTDFDGDGSCDFGDDDDDNDGGLDWLDCVPFDPAHAGTPAEVAEVRLGTGGTKHRVSWLAPQAQGGSATVSDVVRGVSGGLPVGSGAELCLLEDGAASHVDDLGVPASGQFYWYLVRASNACGLGSYGQSTDGTDRATTACAD